MELPRLAKVNKNNEDVVLIGASSSYRSKLVRLGLIEKGIRWRNYNLKLEEGENLEPWYLNINPNGYVPTLIAG